MITRFAGVALFCLLAQGAVAQTVQIRSGEHGTFTRLVMTLPVRPQWRTETGSREVTLIFAQPGLVFDTKQVFARITHARLADVRAPAGQARLELGLACDCELSTFWHDPNMLVIDISDRPGQALAETGRLRPPKTPRRGRDPAEIADLATSAAGSAEQRLDEMFPGTSEQVRTAPRPLDPEIALPPTAVDLAGMQSALLRHLGRAASQGLLTPRRRRPGDPDRPVAGATAHPSPLASGTPIASAQMPDAPTPGIRPDIRLQSGMDDAMSLPIGPASESTDHSACLSGDLIDVAVWGQQEEPFGAQVGPLMRDLLGEFDRVRPETAIHLAQLYLFFGLGTEARQVLNLIDQPSEQTQVMAELGLILDDAQAQDGSLLRTQVGCDTPAALWSLLTFDRLPDHITFDHRLILRSFAALPEHLRKQLGPVLARKLTAAGHMQTAGGLLRMIDRREPATGPDSALAAAELAQSTGQPEVAATGFATAIDSNTTASVEALSDFIEQRLGQEQPVAFDRAELAGAYAQEHRGTPLGRRMARAYIAALAASGAFEQAFAEFDRMTSELSAQDQTDMRNRLAAYLTRNASDLEFLRYTLSSRAGAPQTLDPDIALAVGRRLLATGFAEMAENYLTPPIAGSDENAQQLLRADIALARNLPEQAIAAVMTLKGADADARRGQARSLSGEFAAAVDDFTAAGAPDAIQDAAWMAADWTRMRDSRDPVLQEVADLMLATDPASGGQDSGMLAATRRLLDQSMRTRQSFGKLLDAKPMPATPGS